MRIFHALPEAAGAFCEVFHVNPGSIGRGWLGLCAPVVRSPAILGGHGGRGWFRTHFIIVFERFTHPKITGFEVQEPVPPSPSNKVCLKNLCLADSGWGSWDKEIQKKIKKYLQPYTTQKQVPGFRFCFGFWVPPPTGQSFYFNQHPCQDWSVRPITPRWDLWKRKDPHHFHHMVSGCFW